jgi:hypothetical protein
VSEPVFLFSLPRSGSTLVQRLIAGHPQVATTSEPWILLPLLYTLRRPGAYTEYGHRVAVRAIEDFTAQMRGGREEYLFELREFATALYTAAADGERYFLDKTPRYHLVVHEIMELFPEGKFIFLWRQPLAVAASIVDSFGRGNWNLDKYALDLEDGLEYMVAAARPNDPRCITLRYEDVVADTDGELGRVFEFLGLDASEAEGMSDDALRGRMRDRTGVTTYSAVSPEPLTKWHRTMGTALRRSWCRRYLERLGPVRLQEMGYDYDDLMRQVDALPRGPQKLGSDIARRVHGKVQVRAAHRLLQPSSRELEKQAMARQAQLF